MKHRMSIACLLTAAAATLLGGSYAFSQAKVDDWTAPERAARKKNPITSDAASIGAGKGVYAHNCLPCHGPAGKGDGPSAATSGIVPRDLSKPVIVQQTDGALFWKISEGRRPMPEFETQLPEDERWKVVIYIRTLQEKK
ncbi:MAG: c-type cytochrome [Tepidisphaerales bacterium]